MTSNDNEDKDFETMKEQISGPDLLDVAFKKEGITPGYLAKKLKAELGAERTEFAKHRGKIEDEKNVIDWQTRQKARMDAHRLQGHYPADRLELGGRVKVDEIEIILVDGKKEEEEENE